MIRSAVYLDRIHWRLSLYVLEVCGEGRELVDDLADAGCRGEDLAKAMRMIDSCDLNVGLTYSNTPMRNSVVCVGLQADRNEFANTLFHELHHVISHICQRDNIDIHSEDAAYLAGDVGECVYRLIKQSSL